MGPAGEVGRFTVLKGKPRTGEAEQLLRKLHQLVKPIMKSHAWFLPCLSEFYPAQSNLLGVNINRGSKICIRLRPAADLDSFYDLETLVGTMLHELTHNIRGPHDDVFFNEMSKLEDEYYQLRAKGYEGEGFYGKGSRVGIGTSHDLQDVDQMRKQRVAELEKRIRISQVLGKGGRLGGDKPDMRGKTRSEIMAEAAEKRRKARETCGSGGGQQLEDGQVPQDVLREVQAAENESLATTSSGSASRSSEKRDENSAPVASTSALTNRSREGEISGSDDDVIIVTPVSAMSDAKGSKRPPKKRAKPAPAEQQPCVKNWPCQTCTFLNIDLLSLTCAVCLTPRATFDEAGVWQCVCGVLTEDEYWTCRRCGKMKSTS